MDPTAKAEIARATYAVEKGIYYDPTNTDTLSSAEIQLTEGSHYYIEVHHVNSAGTGYLQLGVEIVNPETQNHPNADRNIQKLEFSASSVKKDTLVITINDPNNIDEFYLIFERTDAEGATSTFKQDTSVDGFPSAWNCKQAVNDFYTGEVGTQVDVTRILYDVNGDVTTVEADTMKIECIVVARKLLSINSCDTAYPVITSGVDATGVEGIEITSTADYELANGDFDLPFSGYYRIQFIDEEGNSKTTENIEYSAGEYYIKKAITGIQEGAFW